MSRPLLTRAWRAVVAACVLVIVAAVLTLAGRGHLVPAAAARAPAVRAMAIRDVAVSNVAVREAAVPGVAPHPALLPARIAVAPPVTPPPSALHPVVTVTVTATQTATATVTAPAAVVPAVRTPAAPVPSPSASASTPAPLPSPSAGTGTYTGLRILAMAETKADDLYAWGGTGPSVFDCSGLVYWAATAAGEQGWPRDTAEIAAAIGTRFTITAYPQRGDLALWGSGTPYHVEIVSGPGQTFGIQTYGWAGRATWRTNAGNQPSYYLHIRY